uniref:Uncharacterized protein n=1 Tax=Taeniopygia guttata TaxID=59729 RepID=A0A674G9R5_TAEGU
MEAGTPSPACVPPLPSFPAAPVPTSQVTLPGHFRGMSNLMALPR